LNSHAIKVIFNEISLANVEENFRLVFMPDANWSLFFYNVSEAIDSNRRFCTLDSDPKSERIELHH